MQPWPILAHTPSRLETLPATDNYGQISRTLTICPDLRNGICDLGFSDANPLITRRVSTLPRDQALGPIDGIILRFIENTSTRARVKEEAAAKFQPLRIR